MPQRGSGDPLLKGKQWEEIKAYWRARHPCCAVCGKQLNVTIGHRGPDAMDVGHIVSRDQAKALGWTRAQINSIGNTRPECRVCNRSHGGRLGSIKRSRSGRDGSRSVSRPAPMTSGVWG